MNALLAQECEGSNHKDPYAEVMSKSSQSIADEYDSMERV